MLGIKADGHRLKSVWREILAVYCDLRPVFACLDARHVGPDDLEVSHDRFNLSRGCVGDVMLVAG